MPMDLMPLVPSVVPRHAAHGHLQARLRRVRSDDRRDHRRFLALPLRFLHSRLGRRRRVPRPPRQVHRRAGWSAPRPHGGDAAGVEARREARFSASSCSSLARVRSPACSPAVTPSPPAASTPMDSVAGLHQRAARRPRAARVPQEALQAHRRGLGRRRRGPRARPRGTGGARQLGDEPHRRRQDARVLRRRGGVLPRRAPGHGEGAATSALGQVARAAGSERAHHRADAGELRR